ncbi:MAG: hypothetical protein ACP5OV_07385 [Acidimicrobiales bacterium]
MFEKAKNARSRRQLHVLVSLAQLICWSAFAIELHRAIQGNSLSWAYVFEWPILAGYAIYMWKKLLSEGPAQLASPAAETDPSDEIARQRYNDYLSRVHGTESAPGSQPPAARQPTSTPLTKEGDASVE